MIKIGKLSEITGVSVQAIRFYEREELISPIEVDRWTGYRYYDETSIERICEITYLKSLGFSLNEIKNLDEKTIKSKISEIKQNIDTLTSNIRKLSMIKKVEGELKMKTFINDNAVIGKWKKIGVVKNVEDLQKSKFEDDRIFDFKELYFLPNGEEYWVFSWTKGILYLKEKELPYFIEDEKLFIGVVDSKTQDIDCYAVYEKVDNKKYKAEDIEISDNIELPFINDEKIIGFWETIDLVDKIEDFDVNKRYWQDNLFLKKLAFEPKGILLGTFGNNEDICRLKWTKNIVINTGMKTASEYVIKNIGNETFMIMEWKSGDYTYGGKVNCYYVLKKIN